MCRRWNFDFGVPIECPVTVMDATRFGQPTLNHPNQIVLRLLRDLLTLRKCDECTGDSHAPPSGSSVYISWLHCFDCTRRIRNSGFQPYVADGILTLSPARIQCLVNVMDASRIAQQAPNQQILIVLRLLWNLLARCKWDESKGNSHAPPLGSSISPSWLHCFDGTRRIRNSSFQPYVADGNVDIGVPRCLNAMRMSWMRTELGSKRSHI